VHHLVRELMCQSRKLRLHQRKIVKPEDTP
jgi:hypothetical protein